MNILIEKLSKKQAISLVISTFIIFSFIPTMLSSDLYQTSYGYSAIWLGLLYLVGAYYAKYGISEKIKWWMLLLAYLYFSFFSFIWSEMKINAEYFNTFMTYTSPTMFLSSIFLLLIFSRIKLKDFAKKIVKFFAPLAFGV